MPGEISVHPSEVLRLGNNGYWWNWPFLIASYIRDVKSWILRVILLICGFNNSQKKKLMCVLFRSCARSLILYFKSKKTLLIKHPLIATYKKSFILQMLRDIVLINYCLRNYKGLSLSLSLSLIFHSSKKYERKREGERERIRIQ